MSYSTTVARCARCAMHEAFCLCPDLPRLQTRVQVVVVPHLRDWKRPSNTGRLAVLALSNAELSLFGVRDEPFDPLSLARDGARHWILHPGPGAVPLEQLEQVDRPVRLLVPDGSWRQSNRIANRLCQIEGAVRVRVSPRATVGLRRCPSPDRACTAEAIATALEVFGDKNAAQGLRTLLDEMLRRTHLTRGVNRRV